jgi:carboxyl-terminal processing protease
MSRYYTPSGVTIDKIGISPDREIKEPELSEAELAAFTKLMSDRKIPQFVRDTPSPTEQQISAFVAGLLRDAPALGERLIRRMVRGEINRHLASPPVYDLEYDMVLQEAIKYFSEQGK